MLNKHPEPDQIAAFLRSHPQDYPYFDLWVDKCERELASSSSNRYAISWEDEHIVGAVIYTLLDVHLAGIPIRSECEIRNITVDEAYQNNGIGSQLLEAVLNTSEQAPYPAIFRSDTPMTNTRARALFHKQRFIELPAQQLYTDRNEQLLIRYSSLTLPTGL